MSSIFIRRHEKETRATGIKPKSKNAERGFPKRIKKELPGTPTVRFPSLRTTPKYDP
jgi:hypothetical protein